MNDYITYPVKISRGELEELERIIHDFKKVNVSIDLDTMLKIAIQLFLCNIKENGLEKEAFKYLEANEGFDNDR